MRLSLNKYVLSCVYHFPSVIKSKLACMSVILLSIQHPLVDSKMISYETLLDFFNTRCLTKSI